MDDLKIVKTYSSRAEAEVAKALLDANKIPAEVSADDAGGMFPRIQFSATGVALLVSSKDLKKAEELLKD